MSSRRVRARRLAGLGLRFLVVGGISTLIEIAVFNLLFLGLDWNPVGAKIVASLVALINAYFGNREWTFRSRGHHSRTLEIVLFLSVNAFCLLLGAFIVWAGVVVAEAMIGEPAGPIIVNVVNLGSIAIVVLVRFLLYHLVVFRGDRANKPGAAGAADAADSAAAAALGVPVGEDERPGAGAAPPGSENSR